MRTVRKSEIEVQEPLKRDGGLHPVIHCSSSAIQFNKCAFTLIEVMVALGIFFIAVFAILGVMTNCLRNARALQQKSADAGMVAAEYLALTNIVEEGLQSGNFGDAYPGYTWTRDVTEAGTNGLFQLDIIVQRPNGTEESRLSVYVYSPQSKQSTTPRRPFQ